MKLDMNWDDYLPLRRLKEQMGIPLEPLQGPGWGDPPPEPDSPLKPAIVEQDAGPDPADPAAT
jgi:hypothetical protein